jgi:nitrilase
MARLQTRNFTVASVQASPVFMDRKKSISKACVLVRRAARKGARLIVFPEAFIPTYPDWVWAVPPGNASVTGELYGELLEQSVVIPSDATDELCRAAKAAKAYVVIGVNERNVEASGASIYNTLLYIDDRGKIIGKHRKLVPTAAERLVWAAGDGSTLDAYDTSLGKLGGLICWENYMPLARYAMYAWGTQIYVAATWDSADGWLATLRHIAREGRCYVIGSCIAMRKDEIPDRYEFKRLYPDDQEWINVGNSAIVSPHGRFIAGPLEEKEDILYAEIDPRQFGESHLMFDVAGHYARPDVFQLSVNRELRPMVDATDPTAEIEAYPLQRPRKKRAKKKI